ncbi:MAG: hypothetical protein ABSA69_10465, partial [Verrucomicrobiota bacterium]|jgi:hypothetical protein
MVNRTLVELHPALLFTQDRIAVANEGSQTVFLPPLVTRIDLITDRLSVWDFPFVLGALVELTEVEFMEGLHRLEQWEQPGSRSEAPVFLDLEMVDNQHSFLWMQIIAGLPTARLNRVYSLLKERRLIFGLRTGGIGVLNLANLVRFTVHPEPPEAAAVAGSAQDETQQQTLRLVGSRIRYRSGNGELHLMQSSRYSHAAFELHEEE